MSREERQKVEIEQTIKDKIKDLNLIESFRYVLEISRPSDDAIIDDFSFLLMVYSVLTLRTREESVKAFIEEKWEGLGEEEIKVTVPPKVDVEALRKLVKEKSKEKLDRVWREVEV